MCLAESSLHLPFGMIKERTLETITLLMIGDGVAAALEPRRHVRLWEAGPRPWRCAMQPFAASPTLTRCLGLAEVALGLWLARRQLPGELVGVPEA